MRETIQKLEKMVKKESTEKEVLRYLEEQEYGRAYSLAKEMGEEGRTFLRQQLASYMKNGKPGAAYTLAEQMGGEEKKILDDYKKKTASISKARWTLELKYGGQEKARKAQDRLRLTEEKETERLRKKLEKK